MVKILVYCYGERYLVRFCWWVKFRVGACPWVLDCGVRRSGLVISIRATELVWAAGSFSAALLREGSTALAPMEVVGADQASYSHHWSLCSA